MFLKTSLGHVGWVIPSMNFPIDRWPHSRVLQVPAELRLATARHLRPTGARKHCCRLSILCSSPTKLWKFILYPINIPLIYHIPLIVYYFSLISITIIWFSMGSQGTISWAASKTPMKGFSIRVHVGNPPRKQRRRQVDSRSPFKYSCTTLFTGNFPRKQLRKILWYIMKQMPPRKPKLCARKKRESRRESL
jgi:hypothetical protein